MAHLSFEYSANLEQAMNLQAFCDAMRDIMRDSDIFPLGGVRVRGTRVDVCTVADGHPDLGFIDMTVRMGQGRDADTRHDRPHGTGAQRGYPPPGHADNICWGRSVVESRP